MHRRCTCNECPSFLSVVTHQRTAQRTFTHLGQANRFFQRIVGHQGGNWSKRLDFMAMLRIQWIVVAQQLWAQERVLNNFTTNQFKRVGIYTLSLGLAKILSCASRAGGSEAGQIEQCLGRRDAVASCGDA